MDGLDRQLRSADWGSAAALQRYGATFLELIQGTAPNELFELGRLPRDATTVLVAESTPAALTKPIRARLDELQRRCRGVENPIPSRRDAPFCTALAEVICAVGLEDGNRLTRAGEHYAAANVFERLAFDPQTPCAASAGGLEETVPRWIGLSAVREAVADGDPAHAAELRHRLDERQGPSPAQTAYAPGHITGAGHAPLTSEGPRR